ncbi:MAG: TIGR03000 domain-containing protein [Planctomycetes bacterium]|nr:TIGR03000 domain-containing protein [Planctomycetota bacterium]
MYSMVLMMAVSTSPEAAACGKSVGCIGASCQGVVVASCNGCGGGHRLFGGGCHGSKLFGGGCHGGGCNGHVAAPVASCNGCYGCNGGCNGCHGGLFKGGLFGKHKNKGCNGGCVGYAPVSGCIGTPVYDAPSGTIEQKKEMPKVEPKKGGVTSLPTPAFITVNVPADATITIDGAATKSTSEVRVFSTPVLNPGTVHYYTLTAQVVREGKTYTSTETVAVEAGMKTQISLNPNVGSAFASK